MVAIREITGYATSKDYEALFKAVRSQSIVCIVNFGSPDGKYNSMDVAHSIYTDDGLIQISCRGTCYVWAKDLDDFVRQCEREAVEWIVPCQS